MKAKINRNLFSPLAAHYKNVQNEFRSKVKSCIFLVNKTPVLKGYREKNNSSCRLDMKSVFIKNKVRINTTLSNDLLLQLYHEIGDIRINVT